MPNLAALPMDALAAEVGDLVAREGQAALQYGSAQGRPELREQICEVMALEGIRADPHDVVVTVGSWMALDLVTRIYCDPGVVVLAEGPSYAGALGSFAAYQARWCTSRWTRAGWFGRCCGRRWRWASPSPSSAAPKCSRSVASTT